MSFLLYFKNHNKKGKNAKKMLTNKVSCVKLLNEVSAV